MEEKSPLEVIFDNSVELAQKQEQTKTDLERVLMELREEIKQAQEQQKEFPKSLENSLNESVEKIKGYEFSLSEEDRASLEITEGNFKRFKGLLKIGLIFLSLSFCIVLFSGFFGLKWYKTSIQTRQEVKTELIKDLETEGKTIVDKDFLHALRDEKALLNAWSETKNKSVKDYIKFRNNAIKEVKGVHFKSVDSDELVFID